MAFRIKKVESSNKTIRMPNDLIARMDKLAFDNDISFNQLVVQCCRYALDHLETDHELPLDEASVDHH